MLQQHCHYLLPSQMLIVLYCTMSV